ncbi:MAG: serine/threonine-protein kinase [Sandaracinus sp.]
MSVWDRMKKALGGAPPPATEAPAPPDSERPGDPTSVVRAPDDLDELAAAKVETAAIASFERACAQGREVDALDLARRVLAGQAWPTLALRVAERLDARGDDEGATTVLAPVLALGGDRVPLDAWMLAGEIAERRGDAAGALASYERVVARDFAYPRARERAMRLADELRGDREVDAGATLMGGGQTARRFRVLRELGRGGAGTVFLAEDVPLAREVALKIYQRRGRADRMRMLHEARVPALLAHPSIVRVLDVDESVLGIAMELCPGGSLRAEMMRAPMPEARIRRLVRNVAAAIAHVHARGWVHRDIKPSNVLLRGDDETVLTDFGISAKVGAPGAPNEGSAGFMPKEQRAGGPAAFTMDVHALGVTLLELLAPHGETLEELVSLGRAAMRADPSKRPPLERFLALA